MTTEEIRAAITDLIPVVTGVIGQARAALKRLEALQKALAEPEPPPPLNPVIRDLAFEDQMRACQKKNRYNSSDAAGRAANYAKSRGSNDELRIYPCEVCGGFHLTKMGLNEFSEAGVSK